MSPLSICMLMDRFDVHTKSSSSILSALLPIAAGLLIMYLIQSLCKYYVSYQGHMMGAYMERDMRQQLFDHYEKLSFSYYDQNNSGQMMSKLVSDLFDIAEFAHHGPENLFISVIKIIGSFIFRFSIKVDCIRRFWLIENANMQNTRNRSGIASFQLIRKRKMNDPMILITEINRFSGP